ncbi:hypothetical protein C7E18_22575, partial [Stenotrophomonas maltophilia]
MKWRWLRQVRQWLRQQAPAQYEQMQTWCDAQGESLLRYCQHAADRFTGSADDPCVAALGGVEVALAAPGAPVAAAAGAGSVRTDADV